MDDQRKAGLMAEAMQEAQLAADEGNFPFGAVLADAEGRVIAKAHNTQNSDNDPTAHAEINLIRQAAKQYGKDDLRQFYLVSNGESCSMCMSAAVKAGIVHYVFGARAEDFMQPHITARDIAKHCQNPLDLTFDVLAESCQDQIDAARKANSALREDNLYL